VNVNQFEHELSYWLHRSYRASFDHFFKRVCLEPCSSSSLDVWRTFSLYFFKCRDGVDGRDVETTLSSGDGGRGMRGLVQGESQVHLYIVKRGPLEKTRKRWGEGDSVTIAGSTAAIIFKHAMQIEILSLAVVCLFSSLREIWSFMK